MFTIHPWNCDLDMYLIYNLLDSLSHIFEQEVYQIIFHQIQRLDCSLYVQTIHQRVLLTYPLGGFLSTQPMPCKESPNATRSTELARDCCLVNDGTIGFMPRWMIAHLEPLGWLILGVGILPLQWGFRLHLAWIVVWKAKHGRRTILSQS